MVKGKFSAIEQCCQRGAVFRQAHNGSANHRARWFTRGLDDALPRSPRRRPVSVGNQAHKGVFITHKDKVSASEICVNLADNLRQFPLTQIYTG